jgi:circadian clock protein KaiB
MPTYSFQFFVSGENAKHLEAIESLKKLGDSCLGGDYELKVVDVTRSPEIARASGVLATPTLIKTAPAPRARILGDFCNCGGLLQQLGVAKSRKPHHTLASLDVVGE